MSTDYSAATTAYLPCVTLVNSSSSPNSTLTPCVSAPDSEKGQLRHILTILISVVVTIIMIGIGCAVEFKKIVKHFKNPTGIIVGLLSQFVVMPILGYMWASIFHMDDPETLSLLIVGSCPGGTFSNIVAYWLGGDMELSVVMTSVSVTLSMGMLPLLLFIYSRLLDSKTTSVPYTTVGITIVLVVVPLSIGALLRYKFPKTAMKILRIFGIVGVLALFITAGISVYIYSDSWRFQTGQIISAVCYPLCGMIIGYTICSLISLVANPLWLSHRQRRTVSIETGIQNAQIALSIIQMAGWSLEITGRVMVFPLMYSLSQAFWCLVYIIFYHVVHFVRNGQCPQIQRISHDDNTEKTVDPISVIADNPAFEMKE